MNNRYAACILTAEDDVKDYALLLEDLAKARVGEEFAEEASEHLILAVAPGAGPRFMQMIAVAIAESDLRHAERVNG